MRLELTNFKCHRSKIIDIPDNGLILLHGDSGAGKSTILSALTYALYGSLTKTRTPYSHGTKSTTVKLDIGNISIIRKCPNKSLHVIRRSGDLIEEFEGDYAQEIIEKTLQGLSYNSFLASSYVVQNQASSILTMTPTEQYNFIQKIAFESEDEIDETRVKIKTVLDALKKDTDERKYSLKHLTNQLQRMKDTLPPKRSNPTSFNMADIEKEILSLEENYSNLTNKYNIANQNLQTSRKIEADSEKLIKECNELGDYISTIKLNDLQDSLSHLNSLISDTECELKQYNTINNFQKDKKRCLENYEKFVKHKQEHNDSIEKEIEDCRIKLEDMKPSLIFRSFDNAKKEYERVLNLKNLNAKFVKVDEDVKKLLEDFELSGELSEIDKYFDDSIVEYKNFIKISNEPSYECPCCHTDLFLFDNNLAKTDDVKKYINPDICEHALNLVTEKSKILKSLIRTKIFLSEELGSYNITLKELEFLSSPENIEKCKIEYEEFQNQWNIVFNLQARVKELTSSLKDGVFAKMKESILNDLKEYEEKENKDSSLKEDVTEKYEIKRMQLAEYFVKKDKLSVEITEYPTKSAKLNAIKQELEKRKGMYKNSKEYEELSKKYSDEMISINTTLKERRKIFESANEYFQYEKAITEVTNLEHTIEDEMFFIKENMSNIESYTLFGKYCKDAEIIALEKTIEMINIHASEYISQMFTDPISVKLSTFKETTSKFQISTHIEYKGCVYNNIDDLSGGERQRCELAFILALNDVLGSNILLLDECLNNLDSTINTEVLTFLRDNSENKCIIVISHEAIRGVFDHEIII